MGWKSSPSFGSPRLEAPCRLREGHVKAPSNKKWNHQGPVFFKWRWVVSYRHDSWIVWFKIGVKKNKSWNIEIYTRWNIPKCSLKIGRTRPNRKWIIFQPLNFSCFCFLFQGGYTQTLVYSPALYPFTPFFLPSFVPVPFLDQWDYTVYKIHGSVLNIIKCQANVNYTYSVVHPGRSELVIDSRGLMSRLVFMWPNPYHSSMGLVYLPSHFP